MFYSQERLTDIFRFQFRKQAIPDPVIKGLAEFTHNRHIGIQGKDLDGIVFIGAYEDMEAVAAEIKKVADIRYVYDHCVIAHEEKHCLFQFWFKPYD